MSLKEAVKNLVDSHDGLAESFMNENVLLEERSYSNKGVTTVYPRDSRLNAIDFTVEKVEHYGGEGMGDRYYTVYKFTLNDEVVYACFSGYYQSHYGVDYVDWNFVKPIEVTNTEWIHAP